MPDNQPVKKQIIIKKYKPLSVTSKVNQEEVLPGSTPLQKIMLCGKSPQVRKLLGESQPLRIKQSLEKETQASELKKIKISQETQMSARRFLKTLIDSET